MEIDEDLEGIDPVDLMAVEAARIEAHLRELPVDGWSQPSRCEGWSVRDLTAHLAATETYFHACLDGRVGELLTEMAGRGASSVERFNALGIADLADVANEELVDRWSRDNARSRKGSRDRGDGTVDTSVGEYSARWQAFHLTGELAIHADDAGVPVPEEERAVRADWRGRFSRFSLLETKPELTVERADGSVRVRGEGIDLELSDDEFIEAVAGRGDPAALSTMP